MRMSRVLALLLITATFGSLAAPTSDAAPFDHRYAAYAVLLREHVKTGKVDYTGLTADATRLAQVVEAFGRVAQEEFSGWSRAQQLAFWINAYNVFTLKVIVDHYPIQGSWFSLVPRNSIRQIDGVWDELTWNAAGRRVTLDDIEHRILRPTFKEPRIHFAINCASVSCPPIRSEPYVADRLDAQLADSSRRYLASPHGLQLDGSTIRVTSILDWYGEDFIDDYAGLAASDRSPKERAILGAIIRYGPAAAAALVRSGTARLRFLRYDWSLNDIQP